MAKMHPAWKALYRDAAHLAMPDLEQAYIEEAGHLQEAGHGPGTLPWQRHHNHLCWLLDIAPEYPDAGMVED